MFAVPYKTIHDGSYINFSTQSNGQVEVSVLVLSKDDTFTFVLHSLISTSSYGSAVSIISFPTLSGSPHQAFEGLFVLVPHLVI